MIQQYSKKMSKSIKNLTENDKSLLLSYDWPGNVRELENCIQKLTIMNDGEIGIKQLPKHLKYKI